MARHVNGRSGGHRGGTTAGRTRTTYTCLLCGAQFGAFHHQPEPVCRDCNERFAAAYRAKLLAAGIRATFAPGCPWQKAWNAVTLDLKRDVLGVARPSSCRGEQLREHA